MILQYHVTKLKALYLHYHILEANINFKNLFIYFWGHFLGAHIDQPVGNLRLYWSGMPCILTIYMSLVFNKIYLFLREFLLL